MMGRLAGPSAEVDRLFGELRGVIEDYLRLATRQGAGRVEIFGTEAARRLSATGRLQEDPLLSRIRILSPSEEARCSAIAAVSASPVMVSGTLLVIDQGGGSVEVIEAIAGPAVEVIRTDSLDLGADALLAQLRAAGQDLKVVRDNLAREVGGGEDGRRFDIAFGLGSVATKCGWLFSDPPENSRYSPQRAHARRVTVQQLRALVEVFVQTPYPGWDAWRARFDPANPRSDDLDRVVLGAVLLLLLLQKHRLDEFTVSTMGVRHGLVLLRP
jgi:exopolyphosphatase/pppGpp-phosphohydrolase